MIQDPKKAKDLVQRTLINGMSALLIALFIFLAEINTLLKLVFTGAVGGIASMAIWEYNALLKKKNLDPANSLSILVVILYIFAIFFKMQGSQTYLSLRSYSPEIILGVALFGCFIRFMISRKSPLLNIASSFFGIIYIGIPFSFFVKIMYFFSYQGIDPQLQGSWWIIYLIVSTKSADIGGYFVGSYFGKRKLAHWLSPNKTLEGALGGLFGAVIASLFVYFLGKRVSGDLFQPFSYIQVIFIGILIGILGQIGDLAESLLKRDAGVKDSNSIPGVGGILDMVDSLLFTAPFVYLFLKILYC
ncbi:MAG: phosphatidate cytidylyltransferase [Chlamydiales bacterium]